MEVAFALVPALGCTEAAHRQSAPAAAVAGSSPRNGAARRRPKQTANSAVDDASVRTPRIAAALVLRVAGLSARVDLAVQLRRAPAARLARSVRAARRRPRPRASKVRPSGDLSPPGTATWAVTA